MGQQQRERVLGDFRCGKLPVLVATDVAGRGLDLRGNRPPTTSTGGHDCGWSLRSSQQAALLCAGLEHVVNYDFPSRLEVYIHRVGRTGRQGMPGHAYSFFGRHLAALAPSLVRLLEGSGQAVDPNLRALLPAAQPEEEAEAEEDAEDSEEPWSSDSEDET